MNVKEIHGRVLNGPIWLRIRTNGGVLGTLYLPILFQKLGVISLLDRKLLASYEEILAMGSAHRVCTLLEIPWLT